MTHAGRGLALPTMVTTTHMVRKTLVFNERSNNRGLLWRGDDEVKKTFSLVCRHMSVLNQVEVIDDLLHVVVCIASYLRRTVHITANIETSWEGRDLIKEICEFVEKSR